MDVLLTYADGSSETINVAQPLADKLRDEHGERFYLYKPAMIEIMAAEIRRLNAQLDAVAEENDFAFGVLNKELAK